MHAFFSLSLLLVAAAVAVAAVAANALKYENWMHKPTFMRAASVCAFGGSETRTIKRCCGVFDCLRRRPLLLDAIQIWSE